jgi:GTPase SAR1 family protein
MSASGRSASNETTDSTLQKERGSPVRKRQPQSPSSSNVPIVYNYQNYPQSEPEKEDIKASSGFDIHIKLLMLGDSGVGKSSLVLQYANEEFTSNFVTTIGIDYKIKLLNLGKTVVKLQIWDTVCM